MHVDMAVALDAAGFCLFTAVTLTLPGASVIRLVDGPATIEIDGASFTGADDVYGALAGAETITDGISEETPRWRLKLAAPSVAAAEALIAEDMQGAPVEAWQGVLVKATGLIAGEVQPVFAGEVDVPTLQLSRGGRYVEFDCASELERLLDVDTGARLSNAFQQKCWPGDLGLGYMVRILNRTPSRPGYGGQPHGYGGGGIGGGGFGGGGGVRQ